jgi:hypothetical protein
MQVVTFLYKGFRAVIQRVIDLFPINKIATVKSTTQPEYVDEDGKYSVGRSKRARLHKNSLPLTNIRGWSLHGLQLLRTDEQRATWKFVQQCSGMHLPVWMRNHDSYNQLRTKLQEEALNMQSGSMDLSSTILSKRNLFPLSMHCLKRVCILTW